MDFELHEYMKRDDVEIITKFDKKYCDLMLIGLKRNTDFDINKIKEIVLLSAG